MSQAEEHREKVRPQMLQAEEHRKKTRPQTSRAVRRGPSQSGQCAKGSRRATLGGRHPRLRSQHLSVYDVR